MGKGSIWRLALIMALVAPLYVGCAPQQAAVPEPEEVAVVAPVEEEEPVVEAVVVKEMKRIYFDFDQYVLTPESQATLADNATYLQANPGVRVVIEGHCDERGSDEYNLALGERRAKAAMNYLVSLGVNAGRLGIISYGEERPLAAGHNEEAWSQNRRSEFVER